MELEVVVGTYDSSIIGCSVDLLQNTEEKVLKRKYREEGHVGCVRCIASGGHYLASGGTDEAIKLYDMRKHLDVGTLLHHEGSITSLCFSKNTHLLSACEDGTICVWKCGGNWECLHVLAGHKYAVTCMSVHPSGRLAISTGKDRTVRTWNLSTGKAAFTLRLPKAADLVAWSPIGDHYVLTVDGTVMVYSVESGETTATFQVGKTISSVQFVQDTVLAIGGEKCVIELYSITSGQLVASLEGHTSRVKGLSLSPDNTLLFSASSNGAIRAWSLPKTLEECKCVSSVETGSRLTCITALLPSGAESGKKTRKRTLDAVEDMPPISGQGTGATNMRKKRTMKDNRASGITGTGAEGSKKITMEDNPASGEGETGEMEERRTLDAVEDMAASGTGATRGKRGVEDMAGNKRKSRKRDVEDIASSGNGRKSRKRDVEDIAASGAAENKKRGSRKRKSDVEDMTASGNQRKSRKREVEDIAGAAENKKRMSRKRDVEDIAASGNQRKSRKRDVEDIAGAAENKKRMSRKRDVEDMAASGNQRMSRKRDVEDIAASRKVACKSKKKRVVLEVGSNGEGKLLKKNKQQN